MEFMSITSAANYVKTMALNMKWKERKADPTKPKGEEDPRIAELKRQAEQTRRANKLSGIQSKMKSGGKLSPSDMEYLRENHPEEYDKAVRLEKEREAYRRALARCRTKEEVRQLNQIKTSMFVSEAHAIESNANIPKGKKLELMEHLGMRAMAIGSVHAKFVTKPEYHALPDDRKDEKAGKKRRIQRTREEESPLQYVRTQGQEQLERLFSGGGVSQAGTSEAGLSEAEMAEESTGLISEAAEHPVANPAGIYSPGGSVAQETASTLSVTA